MLNPRQRLLAALLEAYAELSGHIISDTVVLPDSEISFKPLLNYLAALPRSREFTLLPPLFDSEAGLPMADMYVELSVCHSRPQPAPALLGTVPARVGALQAAMDERRISRQHNRINVDQALDNTRHEHIVILGDPGSGKTSLMKRAAAMIAAGAWQNRCFPLYIPLRRYWASRQLVGSGELSLLRYATARLFEFCDENLREFGTETTIWPRAFENNLAAIDELGNLLARISGPQRRHVIFLLDGLDEIAADPQAVAQVGEEIRRLRHAFAWVVTSRRTGFFGGLDEDIRYEVVDLDNDGITQLVQNRFQAAGTPNATTRVLTQILPNPRLLAMARNPFLLTLLCRLHGEGDLPLHRSEVYQRIIALARRQWVLRTKNEAVFGPTEQAFLADFCHYLYTSAPRAPRHLFSPDDWAAFAAPAQPPDLRTHFLGSRLLDQWGDASDYHLVHLTLHEYLVAESLTTGPWHAAAISARIHQPHWRMVLRFVAGCLRQQGRNADLANLLRTMLAEVDLHGLMYLETATLLAEAGISDSNSLLGFDLRERLWQKHLSGRDVLANAAGRALGLLAPAYALDKISDLLEQVPGPFAIGMHDTPENIAGNRALNAMRLLSDLPHPETDALLIDILLDGNRPQLANEAVTAAAKRDLPQTRQAVLAAAAKVSKDGPALLRLRHLAAMSGHAEYAPFARALLARHTPPDVDTVTTCALINDPALHDSILPLIQADPGYTDTWSAEIWDAVCSRSSAWRAWISNLADASAGAEHPLPAAVATAIRLRLINPARLQAHLDAAEEEDLESLIEAIALGAMEHRATPPEWETILLNLVEHSATQAAAVLGLSVLDEQRLQRGIPPRHTDLFACLLNAETDNVREMALEALGHAGARRRRKAISAIAADHDQAVLVRVAAIRCMGQLAQEGDDDLIEQLDAFSALPDFELASEAAAALIRTAPQRLGKRLHAAPVLHALGEAATEHGMMFFESFYVDASGVRHDWGQASNQVSETAAAAATVTTTNAAPIFVSYNSKDSACVTILVEALRAAGVAVCWDRDELPRTGRWQDELYSLIRKSSGALIVCGPHGPGAWQQEEIDTCLMLTKSQPGFSLRSIWLAGTGRQSYSGFLDNYDRLEWDGSLAGLERLTGAKKKPN